MRRQIEHVGNHIRAILDTHLLGRGHSQRASSLLFVIETRRATIGRNRRQAALRKRVAAALGLPPLGVQRRELNGRQIARFGWRRRDGVGRSVVETTTFEVKQMPAERRVRVHLALLLIEGVSEIRP